ncbi:hypothetical protein N7449_010722 [Penicillium cf. viridicatum]|uniref:Uncharacterized protein n=1 Tax=Penicillium cf. viridicatum TaxID=2972119 RepID=A0A9W9J0K4_9EURO|nr:hypothetical protein N7449_010722 [Penicillium cf. viridicatum]
MADHRNTDGHSKEVIADAFAAYNGQTCFVTDRCTDGSSKEKNPDQRIVHCRLEAKSTIETAMRAGTGVSAVQKMPFPKTANGMVPQAQRVWL